MGFFENIYYGNTVQAWAIALLIVVGAFIIGKIVYLIFGKAIKALTSKTKTKLDDIIVDMVEEPAMLAIILAGMWYATTTLVLSDAGMSFFDKVFWGLIIINVAWLISRLFEALLTEYVVPLTEKSESDFDDQLLPIARKGIKAVIWVLAIIVALDNAGFDIFAILAGLGIGGLALALAAKDLIANIFGGIMIFFDKPFKIKERIKISGFDGFVEEIGIRSTRIRTLDGTLVSLPNSIFVDEPVENISREPTRKVTLNLGLTYDTTEKEIEKAISILEKISERHDDKIDKNILLSFNSFGDFSLGILFIYFIRKNSDILKTQTAINLDILKEFNKAKLGFAFPTQTIELVKK